MRFLPLVLALVCLGGVLGCGSSDGFPAPGNEGDNDGPSPSDDDTPPIDGICGLAVAVPSTAPATSAPWALETIDTVAYPTAVCNDGTAGVFAIRRNPASTHWLIWLEGGGSCSNAADCAARWQASGPALMSNTEAKQQAAQGTFDVSNEGIFADDPTKNPNFFNANLVKVQYCSSDGWTGDRAAVANAGLDEMTHWSFRGRAIVAATVQTLLDHEGLAGATDVVFGGGSAGGVGTYNNVDEVAALLPASVRYVGMPDAGFRLNYPAFDPVTGVESTASPTTSEIFLAEADANWGGRGAMHCDAVATAETRALCRSGAYLVQNDFVATPLLIIQSQLDAEQLGKLGIDDASKPTAAQSAYMTRFGAAMRTELARANARHSIFGNYATLHVTATNQNSASATANGVTEVSAITSFHADPCTPARNIDPEGEPIPPVVPLRTCPTSGKGAVTGDVCFAFSPIETGLPATGQNASEYHYALRPTRDAIGKLVIFLVGSGGAPDNAIASPSVNFYTTARDAGMHVLALAYYNDTPVGFQCAGNDGCFEPTRLSILTGSAKPGASAEASAIEVHEGVYVRLASALAALVARDPTGGWDRFFDSTKRDDPVAAIAWSRVIASGHSQGGGHAALLGKYLPIERVIMLASPCDAVGDVPASYLAADANWKTSPASAYFGLDAPNDPLCSTYAAAWQSLGLPASAARDDAFVCGDQAHAASIRCVENAPTWLSMLTD